MSEEKRTQRKRQRVISVIILATGNNLYYYICVCIPSWGKKASHEQNISGE